MGGRVTETRRGYTADLINAPTRYVCTLAVDDFRRPAETKVWVLSPDQGKANPLGEPCRRSRPKGAGHRASRSEKKLKERPKTEETSDGLWAAVE